MRISFNPVMPQKNQIKFGSVVPPSQVDSLKGDDFFEQALNLAIANALNSELNRPLLSVEIPDETLPANALNIYVPDLEKRLYIRSDNSPSQVRENLTDRLRKAGWEVLEIETVDKGYGITIKPQ